MNIVINKLTNMVEGVNIPSTPFTSVIAVQGDFTLGKTIKMEEGEVQKTNENKDPLYKLETKDIEYFDVIVKQAPTTEDTGKPIIIQAQKLNENDEPLYYGTDGEETTESISVIHIPLQPSLDEEGNIKTLKIFNGDGEIVEELPLYLRQVGFEFVETTESEVTFENELQPIIISEQKKDADGDLLYLKDIIETQNREVIKMEEVTISIIPTEYEDEEITEQVIVGYEKLLDENGEPTEEDDLEKPTYEEVTRVVQVPSKFRDLEPIMIPNIVDKYFTIFENPSIFTIEEVLGVKYQTILDNSNMDYILADIFLNEEDLDLTDLNHSANTGVGILELLPLGEVKTKPIDLSTASQHFRILELDCGSGVDVLINDQPFVQGILKFNPPVSSVVIKFKNTTDRPKLIRSYAVGY